MIDNVVVPVANGYGLAEEYKYLKSSIQDFLTGSFFSLTNCTSSSFVHKFLAFCRITIPVISSLL